MGNMTATNPDDVMDSETVSRIPLTSKIFAISGSFPTVRSCLLKRGWIEKRHRFHFCSKTEPYMWPFKHDLLRNNEPRGINKDVNDNCSPEDTPEIKSETDIIEMASYLLNYYPPTLIWASRKDAISYNHLLKNQIVNHFNQSGFTTKAALCSVIHNLNWTCDVDPDKIFPRCFHLSKQIERDAFVENFRLTACFNVIKWLIKKAGIWNSAIIDKDCIIVPERLIKFAFVQCLAFLSSKNHDDIEETCEDIVCAETDWDWFIGWTYQLKNDNCIFFEWKNYLLEFHKIAGAIQKVWPQWNIDGDRNVWILKPAAKSRGQGIIITESLHDIMGLVKSCNNNYVVQKYIEQPLLIGGVKFDIRQWFLVTDYNPLTMWMYRDSYLRFCSMLFTLDHKDASIHLCNNSIQCNFLKSANRVSILPEGNMITNEAFKKILANQGHANAWNNTIYPGMRSAIISVLRGAQEQMIGRKNCFELYGADFMIDEKLQPWLIEINSSPCLAPSTPVTKRLCSNVIEDLFKVVLDRRIDDNCSTGHFELGYQEDPLPWTESCTSKLVLTGNNIEKLSLESPKSSRLYSLITNRNILSLKQMRPRFEEPTISENVTPWYASKFYKSSCNYKFNTSYIDKIVNDIKNNKKYSYYSVNSGTIHPESHYVVPQMFSTFKNQKSFINFKSNNNSIINLEKKYLKHSKLEKLIKSECNSQEKDIKQISKQEKLKADLHRKTVENTDLKTRFQNQALTKKKLTDVEMKRSPDINIRTLVQSQNTDNKQQTLKLLKKEQNLASNKFNNSKKKNNYRSSNDSNDIIYQNQITPKTSTEKKMNLLLKKMKHTPKFENIYSELENKSNGNPLNMQKFYLKHSKMMSPIHMKKSIKNR